MKVCARISLALLVVFIGGLIAQQLALSHLSSEASLRGCSPEYLLWFDLNALLLVPFPLLWPALMVPEIGWAAVATFVLSLLLAPVPGELIFEATSSE
jgi:hypothetical protein